MFKLSNKEAFKRDIRNHILKAGPLLPNLTPGTILSLSEGRAHHATWLLLLFLSSIILGTSVRTLF